MQNAEGNPTQAQQNEMAAKSPAKTPAAGATSPDPKTLAQEIGSTKRASSAEAIAAKEPAPLPGDRPRSVSAVSAAPRRSRRARQRAYRLCRQRRHGRHGRYGRHRRQGARSETRSISIAGQHRLLRCHPREQPTGSARRSCRLGHSARRHDARHCHTPRMARRAPRRSRHSEPQRRTR